MWWWCNSNVDLSIVTNVPLSWGILMMRETVPRGAGNIWKISAPSPQFYCQSKTAPKKIKSKSKKEREREPTEWEKIFVSHISNTQLGVQNQWYRIRLPMQKTCVRFLIREDPTCLRAISLCTTAAEHELQSPGATTAEPMCHSSWNPSTLELVLCSKRNHHKEKPAHCNQRIDPH